MRQCTALVAILLVAYICKAQDRFATQVVLPEECVLASGPIYGNEIVAKDGLLFVSVQDAVRDGQTIAGLIEIHQRDEHGFYHKVDEIRHDPSYGEINLYGGDIDFDGERLVIGIRGRTGGAPSAVHVMRRDAAQQWQLEARIEAPIEPGWEFTITFGDAVAIDGGTLVVTDRSAFPPTSIDDRGAILIYRLEDGNWVPDVVDTAPYRSVALSFGCAAVSGDCVVTNLRSADGLMAGLRVYELSTGNVQDIRTSEQLYTSVDVDDGLIAARADRSFAQAGVCGEIHTFERTIGGQFAMADVIEHACDVGYRSSHQDTGRRIVVRGDRIAVNGHVDLDDGSFGTIFGSFDVFDRLDGVWGRSEELYFSIAGIYAFLPSGKVGGLAMDGDSVILGHQWRSRVRVTSCGDGTAQGALSFYDISDTYCRADIDGDQALTVFDF
ncbi:MAG: hypothetical protein ACIAQU_10745, partial [Phycisphaerales bacterium JB064]